MGWMILRQPNGKFARYNADIKAITHINMDRTAAETTCRRLGMSFDEAEAAVTKAAGNTAKWAAVMGLLKKQTLDPTLKVNEQIRKTAKRISTGRRR